MPAQKVQFQDLGIMDYQSAWDYQEELLARNVEIKSSKSRNNVCFATHRIEREKK